MKMSNNSLSVVQKICLAGLFIALVTICQKVLAINYIAVVPFVRISFGGTALLFFASFFLGPWFGLLIGVASDLLGYLIFDPKTMGFFPQITLIYALFGFIAYFVVKGCSLIKSKRMMQVIEYGVFTLIFMGITLFVCLNNEVQLYGSTYQITTLAKILIPIILFVLLAVLVVFTILIDKKRKKYKGEILNVYQLSFACFILDIGVLVLFGSIMKGWAFGFQTYIVILFSQLIVSFINIPLNTFLVSYIMFLTRRYINK